jgi:hypothetical protein
MKQITQPLFKANTKSGRFDLTEPQSQTVESKSRAVPESPDTGIVQSISGNAIPISNMKVDQDELVNNVRIPLSWKIAPAPTGSAEIITTLLPGTRWNIICRLIEKQTSIVKSIISSEPPNLSLEGDASGRNSLNKKHLKRLAAATDLLDSLNDLLALQEHAICLRRKLAEQTSAKDKHAGCVKSAA